METTFSSAWRYSDVFVDHLAALIRGLKGIHPKTLVHSKENGNRHLQCVHGKLFGAKGVSEKVC